MQPRATNKAMMDLCLALEMLWCAKECLNHTELAGVMENRAEEVENLVANGWEWDMRLSEWFDWNNEINENNKNRKRQGM